MVYVVPLACCAVSLILGVLFVRWQLGKMIPVLLVMGAVATYLAISYSQQQTDLNGVEYAVFALLVIAPTMMGLAVGGIVGWVRAKK